MVYGLQPLPHRPSPCRHCVCTCPSTARSTAQPTECLPNSPRANPLRFGESKERVRVASADKESAITRKMKRKKIFERGEIFLLRKRNTRPKWETSIIAVPQPYQPLNLMMYVVPPSPLTTVAASALRETAVCCHAIPSPPQLQLRLRHNFIAAI